MAYFDLQVNGYAGTDFNNDSDLSAESIEKACSRLADDNVEAILVTVITDEIESMCRRLATIAAARQSSSIVREIVAGFHIEGPFLSDKPGFIGAHPVTAARQANLDDCKRLLAAADGLTRIMTLAPECDPKGVVTRSLTESGVIVSAGHCDPSLEQLRESIDNGLTMFTHLGNACPLHLHRHDNIIQRVLHLSEHLHVGFIADGVHVPFVALKNYLELVGYDRSFVVSDAISAAGLGPGKFTLGGQAVIVDENLATWAEDRSHLFGAATTMPRVEQNLREQLGLDERKVQKLLYANAKTILSPG